MMMMYTHRDRWIDREVKVEKVKSITGGVVGILEKVANCKK